MATILAHFLALNLVWVWAWRGGSSGLPIPYNRAATLMVTPLLIAGAYLLASDDPITINLDLGLVAYVATFASFTSFGWGRQMDLGDNQLPDDEWGHQLRSLIFKEPSSFRRDLLGLYMRFAWFLIPAAIALLDAPLLAIPPLALSLFAPLIWVLEHEFIKHTPMASTTLPWNRRKTVAWVEWGIGLLNVATTSLMLLLVS